MQNEDSVTVDSQQLRPGMYVYIDTGWFNHPFSLNQFKIKSEDQIRTIHALGIGKIRYSPANSDVSPLPIIPDEPIKAAPAISPEMESQLQQKKVHKERLEQHQMKVIKCQKAVAHAASLMRGFNADIFSKPQACLDSAAQLMDSFMVTLMSDSGSMLFALNDKLAGEEIYNHSINVSVLATLLAKELGYEPEDIKRIGMGCLFHDIGKLEIPSKVLLKTDKLTAAEKSLMEHHPNFGEKIAEKAKLDPASVAIVVQHHEFLDGTGYPRKLKDNKISQLAQLVTIIDLYDNLCNPKIPGNALTPHEALSHLFTQFRSKLNTKMLKSFIRLMGIYPPGSIVRLSNDSIGTVVSISADQPLRPTLLIYDEDIPKDEARMLDLEMMPDLHISNVIRPATLAPEIYEYLSAKKNTTYFFAAVERQLPPKPHTTHKQQ